MHAIKATSMLYHAHTHTQCAHILIHANANAREWLYAGRCDKSGCVQVGVTAVTACFKVAGGVPALICWLCANTCDSMSI